MLNSAGTTKLVQRCVHCKNVLHKNDVEAHPFRCFSDAANTSPPRYCGHCGSRLIRGMCLVHFNFTAEYAKVYPLKKIAERARQRISEETYSETSRPAIPLTAIPMAELIRDVSCEALFAYIILATEEVNGLPKGSLRIHNRERKYANGRRLACWLLKQYKGAEATTTLMGKSLRRNHTSVVRILQEFQPEDSEVWKMRIGQVSEELYRMLLEQHEQLKKHTACIA